MPRRTRTPAQPPHAENTHIALVRKVVLLALIMLIMPLALVLLFVEISIPYPLVAVIFYVFFFGLMAGLSIRLILKGRTSMLRTIASFAIPLGSLLLLGWFTGWRYGIEPLHWGRQDVGWLELLQVLCAAGLSLLVLSAWRRRPLQVEPITTPTHHRAAEAVVDPSPRRTSRRVSHHLKTVKTKKPGFLSRRKRSSKHLIKLSREEEHRCPYCLEIIEPDDPRGTVECRVCHTLHHADCWAITGACQVPHFAT